MFLQKNDTDLNRLLRNVLDHIMFGDEPLSSTEMMEDLVLFNLSVGAITAPTARVFDEDNTTKDNLIIGIEAYFGFLDTMSKTTVENLRQQEWNEDE